MNPAELIELLQEVLSVARPAFEAQPPAFHAILIPEAGMVSVRSFEDFDSLLATLRELRVSDPGMQVVPVVGEVLSLTRGRYKGVVYRGETYPLYDEPELTDDQSWTLQEDLPELGAGAEIAEETNEQQ